MAVIGANGGTGAAGDAPGQGRLPTATVPVRREIPVHPAIVWDLLVDTARWADWGPSVRSVETPDRRLGALTAGRICTTPGLWLPFQVTEFEEGRRWAWSVAGVHATTHIVEPTALGCRVTFGVPALALVYSPVCAIALRRIEQLATRGRR
jgi:uncharacterized protein YndB with AHSA1/START domain